MCLATSTREPRPQATGRTTDRAGAGWIRIVIPQSLGDSTWFCPKHTYGWVSDGYVKSIDSGATLARLQEIPLPD